MKSLLISLAVLAFMAVTVYGQQKGEINRPGLTIEDTFDLYTSCIDNLDVDGLMSTVTKGPDFTFLTSRGSVIDSVEGYRKFHEEWFAETDWTCTFEKVKFKEWDNFGYSLAIFRYTGKDAEGNTYKIEAYFTLHFRKEDGMWKVYYDQITPIKIAQGS